MEARDTTARRGQLLNELAALEREWAEAEWERGRIADSRAGTFGWQPWSLGSFARLLSVAQAVWQGRRPWFLDPACVDGDSEYLSPAGWRKIRDYDGSQVMQYDPADGTGRFVLPDHTY
jgi:hypothetical protein